MSDSTDGSDDTRPSTSRAGNDCYSKEDSAHDDSDDDSQSDDDDDDEESCDEDESGEDEEDGGDNSLEDEAEGDGEEEDGEGEEEEEEEDASSESEEESGDDEQPVMPRRTQRHRVLSAEEDTSDNSDGQSDKCPICLSRFGAQQIGSPENCDHSFCLDCILEWSKTMNTCPVDRQVFKLVSIRECPNGKILKKIAANGLPGQVVQPVDDDEDVTFCEVCSRSDREDRLLLCDGCDMGFHLECLNPPLRTVPVEEWFCPDCAADNTQDMAEALDVEEGEVMALLEDENVSMRNVGLRSGGSHRLLPRTRQSEAVRRRIERLRAAQRRIANVDSLAQPTVQRRRKRVVRRRKRRKPARKTKAKRKTVKKSSSGTTAKRKKRKTKATTKRKTKGGTAKRKKRRTKTKQKKRFWKKVAPASVPTPKSRLAAQLGLKVLPNKTPIIDARASANSERIPARFSILTPSLQLFGTRNDLHDFDDGLDERDGDTMVARARPTLINRRRHMKGLSNSALHSHRPLSIGGTRSSRNLIHPPASSCTPSTSCDLLGSILSDQKMLSLNGKDVKIQRDGSLFPRRPVELTRPTTHEHQRPSNPTSSGTHSYQDERSTVAGGRLPSPYNPSTSAGQSSDNNPYNADRQSSSSGSYNDSCFRGRDETQSDGDRQLHGSCNSSSHVSPHKKKVEKENKKAVVTAEDDDIDIYSDIEPACEEGEDISMDAVTVNEGDISTDREPLVICRQSEEGDTCDTSGGLVPHGGNEYSDDDDDDDLVIDESIKHDEEEEQVNDPPYSPSNPVDENCSDEDENLVISEGDGTAHEEKNTAENVLDYDMKTREGHQMPDILLKEFNVASHLSEDQVKVDEQESSTTETGTCVPKYDGENDPTSTNDDSGQPTAALGNDNEYEDDGGEDGAGSPYNDEEQANISPYSEEEQADVDECNVEDRNAVTPCRDEEDYASSPYNGEEQAAVSPCNDEEQAAVSPCNDEEQAVVTPCNDEEQAAVSPCNDEEQAAVTPCNDEEQAPVSPCNDEEQAAISPCNDEEQAAVSPCNDEEQASISPYSDEEPAADNAVEQEQQSEYDELSDDDVMEGDGEGVGGEQELSSPYEPQEQISDEGENEQQINSAGGEASDEENLGDGEADYNEEDEVEKEGGEDVNETELDEVEAEEGENREVEEDYDKQESDDDPYQQGVMPQEPQSMDESDEVKDTLQEGFKDEADSEDVEEYAKDASYALVEEQDDASNAELEEVQQCSETEDDGRHSSRQVNVAQEEMDATEQLSNDEEEIEEAEIDVSKLAHRQRRRDPTPQQSYSGTSIRRSTSSVSRRRRERGSRDYEEGEIIHVSHKLRQSHRSGSSRSTRTDTLDNYDNYPRVNIAELPRIPKIRKDRFNRQQSSASNGPSFGKSGVTGECAKRTSVMDRLDKCSAAEISWKKLSHNSKTRNYRDGKSKSEQQQSHHRQKVSRENFGTEPMTDDLSKKRSSDSSRDRRKERDHRELDSYDRQRHERERQKSEREKDKLRSSSSSSKHFKERHRDKKRSSKDYKEKPHRHGRERSKDTSALERVREKSYEKMLVPDKVEKREKREQKREKLRQSERVHREEKHREHKKRDKVKEHSVATSSSTAALMPVVPISAPCSREDSPIASKEIYASGDSIIINVNFSRSAGKENAASGPTAAMPADEKQSKDSKDGRPSSVRDRLGEKRRNVSDDLIAKDSKRAKYEEVMAAAPRWNPFARVSGGQEPPMSPVEINIHSDDSFSPMRGADAAANQSAAADSDDSDVVEIIEPPSVGSINQSVADEDQGEDEEDQPVDNEDCDSVGSAGGAGKKTTESSDSPSDDLEEYANRTVNLGAVVPHSPPSPAENNSAYDPFEPTKSLSPSPSPCSSESVLMPKAAGATTTSGNRMEKPEPPPLPELPPLPPEPEPEQERPLPPPRLTSPPNVMASPLTITTSSVQTPVISTTCTFSQPSPQGVPTGVLASPQPRLLLPQRCMPPPPPPMTLPNIHVPPPNYIPRPMAPPPPQRPDGSNIRPIGWPPVGAPPPSLLFPGGSFLNLPPPSALAGVGGSNSSTVASSLTQIGNLLHNQAAQLALLTAGHNITLPPPVAISQLLQQLPPDAGSQKQYFAPNRAPPNGESKPPTAVKDMTEVVDMDVDSPYSPGDHLDPADEHSPSDEQDSDSGLAMNASGDAGPGSRFKDRFDNLLGFMHSRKENVPAKGGHGKGHVHGQQTTPKQTGKTPVRRTNEPLSKKHIRFDAQQQQQQQQLQQQQQQLQLQQQQQLYKNLRGSSVTANQRKVEDAKKEVTVKMDETQLKILDELPSSAVELQVKEKFLKKLNRQERVIEEVKLAIKPYYNRREITKEDYKEILRKSVPKICHNKSGEINPVKIKALVQGYVKKFKYHRKGPKKIGPLKKS